jgi:hypothetical protein
MTGYYASQARKFIRKLIQIQQVVDRKGYVRNDQPAVRQSREHLKRYLDYYRYDTDEKMRGFWDRNREHIRTLLPSDTHPAYESLIHEFISLENQ